MNDATEYVHDHIVNYEPTYIALMEAVAERADEYALEHLVLACSANCGLSATDLVDVDWVAMIQWERENS